MRRSGFVPVNAGDVAARRWIFICRRRSSRALRCRIAATGPAQLSGDPVLLAQAIGNLIDNALKYTSAGGAISVEVHELADSRIQITVADDGPGIPDEEKPKVSARFYRGDASRGTPWGRVGADARCVRCQGSWWGVGAGGQSPWAARQYGDFGADGGGAAAGAVRCSARSRAAMRALSGADCMRCAARVTRRPLPRSQFADSLRQLTLQIAEPALDAADRSCDPRGVEHDHRVALRAFHVAMQTDPTNGFLGLCTAFLAGYGQLIVADDL